MLTLNSLSFFLFSIRMAICVLCAFASFFIVAFSHALWFSLLGEINFALTITMMCITMYLCYIHVYRCLYIIQKTLAESEILLEALSCNGITTYTAVLYKPQYNQILLTGLLPSEYISSFSLKPVDF